MKPRRPYHHGDLKAALKQAALTLIAQHGPRGFSLKEAAALAGVSVAAPYRHYEDREALLAAIAEDGFVALGERLATIASGSPPSVALLESLGHAYVSFAREHPSVFRVMFGADLDKTRHPSLLEVSHGVFARATALVTSVHEQGAFASDEDPRVIALSLWSLVHGLATLHVDGAFVQLVADNPPLAHLQTSLPGEQMLEQVSAHALRRLLAPTLTQGSLLTARKPSPP